ncbi:MAG: histidinol-phosphatase [Firmicutes bacterium]|nr:histidinol-phosphatase [Bacillota bacterium]HAL63160.1 histidinol-phosphatase [Clostridiales bacterium]
MILRDLHVHTTYCDGINTPEEMVLAAIQKGMECLGFSAHSYTFFDQSYCMTKADDYKHEIARLKEKYKDKIKILCGVEQDFYSEEPTDGYDYVIGSVHYIKIDKNYIPVDESAQILIDAANKYFGGDFYKLADTYYKTVAQIKNADIIGHFDLITKFNEDFCLFDENDERYEKSYKDALDALLRQDVYFEINTGAISRGYKKAPYPSKNILDYIKSGGGKTILSSDSHSIDGLLFQFEKYS